MKEMQVLDDVKFSTKRAQAEPLYVDRNGRIMRFELAPGQTIKEHNAPDSPLYLVVLKGQGMFAGGDGQERQVGPNSLLVFEPGENHTIRALNENLVFVGFLHGAPSNLSDKVGGAIGHHAS